MRGSIKIIKRPPPPEAQFKIIQQEIAKQLQPVARAHVNDRKRVTDNFEHKPDFDSKITVTQKQVTLWIFIKNSTDKVSDNWTIGDSWAALDKKGTKPHDITPKRPNGHLRFLWGGPGSYQPKTRPIARGGGPGKVTNGEVRYTKKVKHPGFKPRKFSEVINKRLKRQYDQAIDRGIRIGLTRANKS